MAYDRELADRLREALAGERGVTEKAMFGGLGFLVDGHLSVSASSRGGLLLRVDPAEQEALLGQPHVEDFVMRGRAMRGWVHVLADAIDEDEALQTWVDRGVTRARSLPHP